MTLKLDCPVCKITVAVVEPSSIDTTMKNGDKDETVARDYAKCPRCHREFTQSEIDALAQWT
jgi:endogenous inhibitor of DNA gyrase (YacG/DUF329 family)